MKAILEEISLRANENVSEETTEVLSELSNVEDAHFEGGVRNLRGKFGH